MTSAAALLRNQVEASLALRIPGALSSKPKLSPELLPTGIVEVDSLLGGGIPRGGLTEISGPACSGRTALALSILAGSTLKGAACAWVDVSDALDPESAAACGVELDQLLWVRTSKSTSQHTRTMNAKTSEKPWLRLEHALKATDLILQAAGFKAVVIDMGDIKAEDALRIPLASWYRFRLGVEQSQTALLLLTHTPCAKSSASLLLRCECADPIQWSVAKEISLFQGLAFHLSIERNRGEECISSLRKKLPGSAQTVWQSSALRHRNPGTR